MKAHTSNFKNEIKMLGRELDSKITYIQNSRTIELGSEELNSITPHYEGGILKSVMKQLDIDSNVEIPLGTILTYQFGVKTTWGYNYINYGNYIVYKAEKKEDTNSWQITCYDKMLYSMKDYEKLNITYPITIRNYINAICNKIGLTFKNTADTFANYNKTISSELYLDEDGKSLGYTYRDILDDLAEVTASTICIDEDDKLEIRYIKDAPSKNLLKGGIRQGNESDTSVSNRLFTVYSASITRGSYSISTNLDLDKYKWTIRVSTQPFPSSADIYAPELDNSSSMSYSSARDCYLGILISKKDASATITPSEISDLELQVEKGNASTYEPYAERDTIDEEFLKDVNVNFGEKYGPINTIVLSRSAGADNIYYPSTLPQNPVEIKISDNQIMNGNDRDTYMPDIYNKLNGLEYYINDFTSFGICYYDLCDRYDVKIADSTYTCIMFNDEVNVTQGLEEIVYTDLPDEAVTDYTKSDSTDRRINQTTLIVDKQQNEITALVDTTEDIQKEINPTKDVTGTSFYLEDSTDAELVNFEMEGKTTQETRSGKNILPSLNTTRTINGITFTKNNDGSITINGTATGNAVYPINVNSTSNLQNIPIKNNTQYTLSCKGITSEMIMQAYYNATYYNAPQTFTSISTVLGAYVIVLNGKTINNVTIYPQLEEGSTATEYEQYGVMPSPDYPSELVSVGYQNYFEAEYLQTTANTNINANLYKDTYTLSLENKENFGGVIYIQLYKNNTLITTNGHLLNTSSAVLFSTSSYWYYFQNIPNGNKLTFTLDDDYSLKIALSNATGSQKAFLVKGTQEHSYIPYGKYGVEVTTAKKNLIPFTNQNFTLNDVQYYIDNGSLYFNGTSRSETSSLNTNFKNNFNFTLHSGTYTISHKTNIMTCYLYKYDNNTLITNLATNTASQTFTLSETTRVFIGFYVYQREFDNVNSEIMISKSGGTYEPYKSNTFLYTLNEPLRSIGDTKDLLYIKNGMLYVDRKIGSVVLNTFTSKSGSTANNQFSTNVISNIVKPQYGTIVSNILSSHFISKAPNTIYANDTTGIGVNTNGTITCGLGLSSGINTLVLANQWLSTNKPEVNYILAEPTTEELGKVEIPSTYKSITYIDLNDVNEPTMNITYVRDTQLTNYVEEHISQIIVNEEGITQRVQRIEDSDYDSKINAIETKQTSTDLTIDIISTNIDRTTGDVNAVTTREKNFTFNDSGLNIASSDNTFSSKIDEQGLVFKNGDTTVAEYTKDGSKQKDLSLFGVYYYGMNSKDDTPMFVAQLYTDRNGEECFGHFYNRGD